ncbi:cobalamin biosynthesis protein [Pontitalea aquivivens]|uniref:cobalamin biosynthesis protein n=1 Tax=Pontitalea aquivivens TaxID=3388663 RepID=UPI00397113C6
MRVAGIGFRPGTPAAALSRALAAVEAQGGVDHLATIPQRVVALAAAFPARRVVGVPVAGVQTPTQSARVRALYATGSVAEAAALVAAGPGARLVVARLVVGGVTVAVAEAEARGTKP